MKRSDAVPSCDTEVWEENLWASVRVHAKGDRTLRKDVFPPFKNPCKNLVSTESPDRPQAPSENVTEKHLQ